MYIIYVESLSDYDYELPESMIASAPMEPRDACKMLVYERQTESTQIAQFKDMLSKLQKGDVIVVNETRVIPARLIGKKATGAVIEILLLKKIDLSNYEVLVKPLRRLKPGDTVDIAGKLQATLVSKNTEDGTAIMSLNCVGGAQNLEVVIDKVGEIPLPHYIQNGHATKENYNTVYAKVDGSAAAPTAGLHWTKDLIEAAKAKGVIFAPVVLDVGLGTFRPVKVDDITKHVMHTERYQISESTAKIINDALRDGRRIIATGTTSLRTLEGCFAKYGEIKAVTDTTDIFIYPPYKFKVISGLITNFHLPKSTLLMLVASFVGREKVLSLYELAKQNNFRFYSFGDCMFLL
ncbi:MAG: tRNA preQ1(34) S-adenosylmethionine ribosyltransferase-isomerase QueA [Clostridia bacterium]|nr:tRNA preQ1(34) S-adenosylmethionine ribosyltransferase-isomerase QueA [Clostridia bacterium]